MKAIVTGGAGFVGSHVVDGLLDEGHEVHVIDDLSTGSPANLDRAVRRPGCRLHILDLCSAAAAEVVRTVRPEALLLLGAQMSVKVSMKDPVLDARTNVLGVLTMMQAAVAAGTAKVVFAASGGTIYGDLPDGLPLTEDRHGAPSSFYGLTKRLGVDYLRLYRENAGIDYAALALGNVYGPRQDPAGEAGVVAIFADRMARGLPCVINGDGSVTRDYVYVTDVAEAFIAATRRGSGLINIGTAVETSVLDVHGELRRHFPGSAPAVFGPGLPGEVARVCLDNSRARVLLGWAPKVSFADGVARYVGDGAARTRRVAENAER